MQSADPQKAFNKLPTEQQKRITQAIEAADAKLNELTMADPAIVALREELETPTQQMLERLERIGNERAKRLLPIAREQARLSAVTDQARETPVETLLTSGERGLAQLYEKAGLTSKGKAGEAITLPKPTVGSGEPMAVVTPPADLESTPSMVRQQATGVCYLAASTAGFAKDKEFLYRFTASAS